jgi:SAM-dependent methyltransferase
MRGMPPERPEDGPQNIYDDPQFFAGYATLERFGAGWERAMELPDFLGLLPGLGGRRALDLGCGAGQLALHLAHSGASEVVGIDVSERMLGLARTERAHPRVTYLRQSMEETDFPPARFDLVVSSLAFHYVRDYRALVGRIGRWLAPGGVLVFSTEHPIYTARAPDGGSDGGSDGGKIEEGWSVGADGKRLAWALDRYSEEGPRERRWFVPGVVRYHRPLATLLNGLLDAGLTLERVAEPVPAPDWVRERPQAVDEWRRPMFILVRASKA